MFGQSVTMTINGAYADSSGNARNSNKLQGKDSTALLAYTKVLVSSLGMPTCVQGDLLYGSGTNTYSKLAKNTTATRYLANTGTTNNPAWAQIALGTGVSGTLGYANGGTNATTQINAKTNMNYWTLQTASVNYNGSVGVNMNRAPNYAFESLGYARFEATMHNLTAYPYQFINLQNDSAANGLTILACSDGNTTYGGVWINFCDAGNVSYGQIYQDPLTGSAILTTPSDVNLKKNIIDTKLDINTLMQIKVRDYQFKKSKYQSTGFIAQELYAIYPSLVYKPKDSKSNWQVNYQGLIPLLVKSIQDQQAEISDLTKRIEKLEKLIK